MPESRAEIKKSFETAVAGTIPDSKQNSLLNDAVMQVFSDCDLRTAKRMVAITPALFNNVYEYAYPSDLKGTKVIDIAQLDNHRNRFSDWRKTTVQEFDMRKRDSRIFQDYNDRSRYNIPENSYGSDNICAVSNHDFIKSILISKHVKNTYSLTIDPLTEVGTWTAVGDTVNITADSANVIKGNASIRFDIGTGGTITAGIQNVALASFDITKYITEGAFFVWVYNPSVTGISAYTINYGSDASNYYSVTVTQTNEAVAFYNGWNLLRFDLINATKTLSPVNTACTYVSLYMTKTTGTISEVGFRFNNLKLNLGTHHNLWYYTQYGWQTPTGTWKQKATIDTDLLNAEYDEIVLIKMKYAELAEMYLRDQNKAAERRTLYTQSIQKYLLDNPSEAMIFTTTSSDALPPIY